MELLRGTSGGRGRRHPRPESLIVDRPPALVSDAVENLRLRACIHKADRRWYRVGEPEEQCSRKECNPEGWR